MNSTDLNVLPSYAGNNLPNSRQADSKFNAELFKRDSASRMTRPDLQNLFSASFYVGIFRTACGTTLISHVVHIVQMLSKEKVCRIYTGSVITFVAHASSKIRTIMRNFTKVKFVGNAVCALRFTGQFKNTISSGADSSSPNPAAIGFFNLAPKVAKLARREVDRLCGFGKTFFSRIHNYVMDFVSAVSELHTPLRHDQFLIVKERSQV